MDRTSQNANPLVSVIIPTYNQIDFLIAAIRSVFAQSYPYYEILVVNDGSSDDTLSRLQDQPEPVQVISLPHGGSAAKARNCGIKASKGTLIAFLDHDDLWHPEKLSKVVGLFEADADLGLVYSDGRFLYPNGSTSPPFLRPDQKNSTRYFEELLTTSFIYPSTVVIKRKLIVELNLFNEKFVSQSNHLLWLEAFHRAPVGFVPDPLVWVRKHPESRSAINPLAEYEYLIQILEHLKRTIHLNPYQYFLLRRSVARSYTHLGLHDLRAGDRQQSQKRFLSSLRWNPLQRRAWLALIESLLPEIRRRR